MLKVTVTHQTYLYPAMTDFRFGVFELRKRIGMDAKAGSIYIFANKALNAIKVIEIETNPVWLYQKNTTR